MRFWMRLPCFHEWSDSVRRILVADLVVPPLTALPESGHVLATDDFLLDSGGCAANTAIDLTRLGYSPAVLGRVGSDWFGDFVVDDLARRGVGHGGNCKVQDPGTSKTVVLTVTGEDRRYIHTIGANADFTIGDLDHESVNTASVFYLAAFWLLGLRSAGFPAQAASRIWYSNRSGRGPSRGRAGQGNG